MFSIYLPLLAEFQGHIFLMKYSYWISLRIYLKFQLRTWVTICEYYGMPLRLTTYIHAHILYRYIIDTFILNS